MQRRTLFGTAASLLAMPARGQPAAGRREALVIGCARYEREPQLPNVAHDLVSVAEALEETGFTVRRLADPDRSTLLNGLGGFERACRGAEAGLVWFGGHGLQWDSRNFLLARDSDVENEQDLDWQSIELGKLASAVGGASARIVVADACRSNLSRSRLAGAGRSIERGLARVGDVRPGTALVFAASPNEVASDGPQGGNSPFAAAFVRAVRQPGLELEQVYRETARSVEAATGGRQIPALESRGARVSFFFIPAPSPTPDTALLRQPLTIAPDIYLLFFPPDRAELDGVNSSFVTEIAAAALRENAAQVEVQGFASLPDSPGFTMGMAMRLAQLVAAALARAGVPRASLALRAFGETRPLVPGDDMRNVRVMVRFR